MRRQDRERGHGVDWQWFRNGRCQRLGEEGDSSFSFRTRREVIGFEALVALRDEKDGRPQGPFTISLRWYLKDGVNTSASALCQQHPLDDTRASERDLNNSRLNGPIGKRAYGTHQLTTNVPGTWR